MTTDELLENIAWIKEKPNMNPNYSARRLAVADDLIEVIAAGFD